MSARLEVVTDIPAGTYCVLPPDGGQPIGLFSIVQYEVGDGDLILISRAGRVVTIPAGSWLAIGTVEHGTDGASWIAFECLAPAAAS